MILPDDGPQPPVASDQPPNEPAKEAAASEQPDLPTESPPAGAPPDQGVATDQPRRRPRRRRRRRAPRQGEGERTPSPGQDQGGESVTAVSAEAPASPQTAVPHNQPRPNRGPRFRGPGGRGPRARVPGERGPRPGGPGDAGAREPHPRDGAPREQRPREGAPSEEKRREGPPRDAVARDRPGRGKGRPDRDRRGPKQGKYGGGRDAPREKPERKLYTFEFVVDRGFEDVASEDEGGETRRVHWTIVKRTTADQRSTKLVSAVYVLQRDGVDTEFANLGAARAAVNKTIVHPEKLTRSKSEYAAAKKK